jgi:multicomponent Na+:H+ antiporter subunit F
MNLWLITAGILIVSLIPCGIRCAHGDAMDRLVGLEAAGLIQTQVLLVLAEGIHRKPFLDLALTMALLAFAGGLVFVRFLERWI